MKKYPGFFVVLFLSLIVIGCSAEQQVLWNLSSEPGQEVKVRVQRMRSIFLEREISVRIDGDDVINGSGGKDKKNEYNADYKGKKVKAVMIYNTQTTNETVEVYIEDKLVGEFVF